MITEALLYYEAVSTYSDMTCLHFDPLSQPPKLVNNRAVSALFGQLHMETMHYVGICLQNPREIYYNKHIPEEKKSSLTWPHSHKIQLLLL